MQILVVEDDDSARRLITELLEHRDYAVTAVNDGRSASRKLRRTHGVLIVLDIQMPRMDGLTVARQIRADEILAKLPILAVTALTERGDAARVLEAGADAYLAKPASPFDAADLVDGFLRPPKIVKAPARR